ncbi:MAG TPA: UDP-N-acetylmuramoyl-tripeptide--D-alanyl-D-alanine ligase [Patescibacteria group bacterium]|nr:UDP-N-acetylmuramoyl-tripeptide--D-alanyl-D-alanine ligase [Patescibacteria group bacterium]
MKSQIKTLAQSILRKCAVRLLTKFHPDVIAVTGSIGKTSAKDAIYEVLAPVFNTRKNEANFNNEIGVPLTIIGSKSAKNIFDIFRRTYFSKNFPEKLVLEMGADRVGDLKYLTSFIKPNIAVVTRVACSHLEYFCDLDGVAKEKGTLVESLDKNGWAVLNFDDKKVREMKTRTIGNILFYGTDDGADVVAKKIKSTKDGLSFDLIYKKEKEKINLKVVGRHNVYSALSAVCCGIIYGMTLKEIKKNLENYRLPKDRTNIINGINGSIIISDIYNANPESMLAAFEIVNDIKNTDTIKRRRVFILADMLELGDQSDKLHLSIGRQLKGNADFVILVGEKMKKVFDKYKKDLGPKLTWFENSLIASQEIWSFIQKNDIILVKGSRGMKMERIVESIKL